MFGSNHVLPCASSRSSSPLLQALLRHCFGPQPQSCPWGERDLQDKSSHPANRRCLMAYCWSCTHLMHRGHDAACKPGGLGKVCKRTCFLLYLVKCNSLVNKQISMLKKTRWENFSFVFGFGALVHCCFCQISQTLVKCTCMQVKDLVPQLISVLRKAAFTLLVHG